MGGLRVNLLLEHVAQKVEDDERGDEELRPGVGVDGAHQRLVLPHARRRRGILDRLGGSLRRLRRSL